MSFPGRPVAACAHVRPDVMCALGLSPVTVAVAVEGRVCTTMQCNVHGCMLAWLRGAGAGCTVPCLQVDSVLVLACCRNPPVPFVAYVGNQPHDDEPTLHTELHEQVTKHGKLCLADSFTHQ
jgi:hypothetical protein